MDPRNAWICAQRGLCRYVQNVSKSSKCIKEMFVCSKMVKCTLVNLSNGILKSNINKLSKEIC